MDELINYRDLFCVQGQESDLFPWWAVDNSDELPIEPDLRLLKYGVELCAQAEYRTLAKRLEGQIENHRNGFGRRPEESS